MLTRNVYPARATALRSVSPLNGPSCSLRNHSQQAKPIESSTAMTETVASTVSNCGTTIGGKAILGSMYSVNFSIPSGEALANPAKTENTDSTMSGTVIALGDSCGWPWPRYSPKKVRYTQRVM